MSVGILAVKNRFLDMVNTEYVKITISKESFQIDIITREEFKELISTLHKVEPSEYISYDKSLGNIYVDSDFKKDAKRIKSRLLTALDENYPV